MNEVCQVQWYVVVVLRRQQEIRTESTGVVSGGGPLESRVHLPCPVTDVTGGREIIATVKWEAVFVHLRPGQKQFWW